MNDSVTLTFAADTLNVGLARMVAAAMSARFASSMEPRSASSALAMAASAAFLVSTGVVARGSEASRAAAAIVLMFIIAEYPRCP